MSTNEARLARATAQMRRCNRLDQGLRRERLGQIGNTARLLSQPARFTGLSLPVM